jgi:coenzyme F420-0:L-glutamate ligase/coenzyme F420-1:gamma-L-glutamate ligase
MPRKLEIVPVPIDREIIEGDNLPQLIARAVRENGLTVSAGDVFVVAQKIVSKAEGRAVKLGEIEPSDFARAWASLYGKDARVIEVILRESRRIVRMDRGVMICETHQGFVCANAGVDCSNVPAGKALLSPKDPDASARAIRLELSSIFDVALAVIISDSFGRPWREGQVNVALGVAGMGPLLDYRGQPDSHGRLLEATFIAVADELASASELVMGKSQGIPVALISGANYESVEGSAVDLQRSAENDLFR